VLPPVMRAILPSSFFDIEFSDAAEGAARHATWIKVKANQ